MTITAETYTTANGSNMDGITYKDSATVSEIAADLRSSYTDWDYAIISDEDGETLAIVEREPSEYTITETADILGVSRQRVHAMLKNGQLDGHMRGNSWFIYRYSVENRLQNS